jgi:hypothetical protein
MRLTRGSSLSDGKIIARINKEFVTIEINITDDGFPKELPGLGMWQKAYENDKKLKFGFATTVALSPDGRFPLGTSGCVHLPHWQNTIGYEPSRFLPYLDECLDRHARARAIAEDTSSPAEEREADRKKLAGEILRQLEQANPCSAKAK